MPPEILFYSDFPFGYHNPEAEQKMARFAARGYRVHYVEQLGIRNPQLRHLGRLGRLLLRRGDHSPASGVPFEVISPKLLPPRGAPLLASLNRAWLARQLVSVLDYPAETILWIRYPTPELVPLAARESWRLVLYELVDDHPNDPKLGGGLRKRLRDAEERILECADLVFAWSEPIRRRLAAVHPNVALAPPAIDVEEFSNAAAGSSSAGRVACYAGSFDYRLDAGLLIEVARRLPDWEFTLAGRIEHEFEAELRGLANVRPLGQVAASEVPELLARSAVCLMPYRQNAWTENLVPIKLVEYLAAGKPVVSTPLRAAQDFADVVGLASGPREFAEAVVASARDDSPESRRRRIERAAPFSWEKRIDEMEAAIRRAERGRGS